MFIYNITFVVDPDQETHLLEYFRKYLIPKLFSNESPAKNPELKKVMETGGERLGKEHGLSIALSASFETEELAHLWNDHLFIPALSDFPVQFGSHSLFFVTLLESLTI